MPLWFSLATHGTEAYTTAVEQTITVARAAGKLIEAHARLEIVTDQRLSICVFRRIGWSVQDYHDWSDKILEAGDAFVTPTKFEGETVLRFCIVNPKTTVDHIKEILATL